VTSCTCSYLHVLPHLYDGRSGQQPVTILEGVVRTRRLKVARTYGFNQDCRQIAKLFVEYCGSSGGPGRGVVDRSASVGSAMRNPLIEEDDHELSPEA
jgi:hypothetical protein